MTNYAIGKRRPSSDFSARQTQNKKIIALPQLPDANLWNALLNRLNFKRNKNNNLPKRSTSDTPPPMMNDDSKTKLDSKKVKKRPKRRRQRNLARKMCRKYDEPKRWNAALKNCKLLKSKFFDQCHDYVDFKSFYSSCIMDVCSCQPFAKCYCESLSAYTAQCESRNVTITWKDAGCIAANRGCTIEGSTFELCPPACEPLTCENFRNLTSKTCHEKFNSSKKSIIAVGSICKPSCRCPGGKVISRRENKCVNIDEC
uniref:VWF/SSPO/Zonadhesin-like cysteine-rich domain-containing protein n=1 Tax=Romanomermis culicivorax TaxID=13658 RepID=A0A915KH60_ROMCU